jgi:hypothetical protein
MTSFGLLLFWSSLLLEIDFRVSAPQIHETAIVLFWWIRRKHIPGRWNLLYSLGQGGTTSRFFAKSFGNAWIEGWGRVGSCVQGGFTPQAH